MALVGSYQSVIAGAKESCNTGRNNANVGGVCNYVSGNEAFIGGGCCNSATAKYSSVIGGYNNSVNCPRAVIVGGAFNRSQGFASASEVRMSDPSQNLER